MSAGIQQVTSSGSGSGSPRVLLCGHMDTVSDPLPVRVEDGVLYGRGSVDAKAPLAAMIEAATHLRDEFNGTITVVGAVDEEGQNRGVRALIKDGTPYDLAVFGEPTNVDSVTVGYKGNLAFSVTCETETGHSSAPWLWENSIEHAYSIWSEIKGLCTTSADGSHFNTITATLRKLEGGHQSNTVPPRCDMKVDMRIPPGETSEGLEKRVLAIIDGYSRRNPRVRVIYRKNDYSEPYLSPSGNLLVKAFTSAILRVRGSKTKLLNKTGSGDMNIFGTVTGIPCVTYGPGNNHFDHRPDEQIRLQEYLDGIEVLTETLRRLQVLYEKRSKMGRLTGENAVL